MAKVANTPSYGLTSQVDYPFAQAVEKITEALKTQGFGILTEIDVQATMKKKIDKDLPNYVILGACNPNLAFKALSTEYDIGLLLPCNVVVYTPKDGGKTVVSIMDPNAMVAATGNQELAGVAAEARQKLTAALEAL